jgi:hypothetical protein
MNEKVDIIALYQQEHLGLKRIARITGLSPSGVRKKLRAAGVYWGLKRQVARTVHKNLLPDFFDPHSWRLSGGATVRRGESGLLLYSPDAFSVASYQLPERTSKKIRLHVRLSHAGTLFAGVRFGLRSGGRESGVTVFVQGGLISLPEWVTELSCRGVPEVFFQGGTSPSVSEFFLAEAWVSP